MHPLQQHIGKAVPLAEHEFASILASAKLRRLKKNQLLLHEGEQAHADHFVLQGCLCQYYIDASGREHIIQFAFPDWWIGDWYSILNSSPTSYYIEAMRTSLVLQFDYEVLNSLFQKVPALERYFRIIFQRGFAAQQRRILWMQQPAKERYEEFQRVYGYFEKSLSQSQVASYLGITRESLSRIKKRNMKRL